jgi:hypothetical protein
MTQKKSHIIKHGLSQLMPRNLFTYSVSHRRGAWVRPTAEAPVGHVAIVSESPWGHARDMSSGFDPPVHVSCRIHVPDRHRGGLLWSCGRPPVGCLPPWDRAAPTGQTTEGTRGEISVVKLYVERKERRKNRIE